jgi:phage terminase large subunit
LGSTPTRCYAPLTAITPSDLKPQRRPYQPYGTALQALCYKGPELLVSGPAGTGKSRALLEKLHLIAEGCPGSRSLIVRRTRVSVTESALVTFEEKVVPEGHPILEGASRPMRQAYRYPNGSSIVIGGLDKPGKVMSTEYDVVYVQEAIELEEDAWEALTTRLRNGILPYQQIIADTNPDRPTHWLKRRCDSGKTLLLESRHEDNPALWDHVRQVWTPAGQVYLAKLDALTGPRKARLRYGRWVQSEGVVYEGWDAAIHVRDRFTIPADWLRYWTVDFGFTNPFVCQWWAQDPDGRVYLYRELYQTQLLVEDAAKRMVELSAGEPKPKAIICDHDAEDRATLARYLKMPTVAAFKDVSPGIQAVAARLRKAGDGKPRLLVMRDSLVRRDPALVEAKKPTCFVDEVDGYIWNVDAGRKQGEEPVKKDDHSMDAGRYLCAYLDCAPKRKLAIFL